MGRKVAEMVTLRLSPLSSFQLHCWPMSQQQAQAIPKFIRRLMPAASDAELQAAADTFRRYLAVVIRMHNRIEREQMDQDST